VGEIPGRKIPKSGGITVPYKQGKMQGERNILLLESYGVLTGVLPTEPRKAKKKRKKKKTRTGGIKG